VGRETDREGRERKKREKGVRVKKGRERKI